ncbi:hypothetical protein TNCV_4929791 [Trichonephila clavipes]|nr:hypothetical protein TNCV_4929791 [Trichonephila clavipes]
MGSGNREDRYVSLYRPCSHVKSRELRIGGSQYNKCLHEQFDDVCSSMDFQLGRPWLRGAIGHTPRSPLVRIDGTLNSVRYISGVLRPVSPPFI